MDLYRKLKEIFRHVEIANEGQELQDRYRKVGYQIRHEVVSPGEYYRVNCPFCGDSRKRLWINHRFAEFKHLAVCYNETRCLSGQLGAQSRKDLWAIVFGNANRVVLPVAEGTRRDIDAELQEIGLPGDILFLTELTPDHEAIKYLVSKKYDTGYLTTNYGVGYCTSVLSNEHRPLTNRIFIPIIMHGKLIGWQGRYVGDIDWKARRVQKYFNLKGMHKSNVLYGFDSAVKSDTVVLCEGVPDAWRIGTNAVALLGNSMAANQKALIVKHFAGKKIAVMLDGLAYDDSVSIVNSLAPYFGSDVFAVPCPAKDPGELTTEECWQAINKAMRSTNESGV
jgi:hypothetical protein